jgi:hypothetical protein
MMPQMQGAGGPVAGQDDRKCGVGGEHGLEHGLGFREMPLPMVEWFLRIPAARSSGQGHRGYDGAALESAPPALSKNGQAGRHHKTIAVSSCLPRCGANR